MHPATLSILLLLIAGCSSEERAAAQPPAPEAQQFYEEFLLSRGLVFGHPLEEADVTDDGYPEVLLNAHIPDCGSCHVRSFFVMSGPEPIFEDEGEGGLAPLEDGSGFTRQAPLRMPGEPLAGSSWFAVETYRWVGSGFEQDPMVELKPFQEMNNYAITEPLQPPVQVATVVLYYRLINKQDYAQAYALLSSQFQEENPFDAWTAGFATTESVFVEEATPVQGNPNEVSITLTAVDSVSGQTNETKVYEGTWTLTEEDGVWKLGSAAISQEESEGDTGDGLSCAGGSSYSADIGKFKLTLSDPNVIIRALDGDYEGGPVTRLIIGRCIEDETNVVDIYPTYEVNIRGYPASNSATLRSNFEAGWGSPLTAGPSVTIDGVTAQTYTGRGLHTTKLVYFDHNGIGYQIALTDTNTTSEAILTDVISGWNFTP